MKPVTEASFIREMVSVTTEMYRMGWDERNSGNISYLLKEEEVSEYLDTGRVLRRIPFMGVRDASFDAGVLAGSCFLITGTGKYFRHVADDPEDTLGIIRISEDGHSAELLWGFRDGGRPTSELPTHMLGHIARLRCDAENRVVLHSHPTCLMAMNHVHLPDEREFTRTLWKMCTESILAFPEGIGVLPWMPCGTDEIAVKTAKKFEHYRIVSWWLHGIYGAARTPDEAFGLIETVEKAAQVYMMLGDRPRLQSISDENLRDLAELFGLQYKKEFLDI